MAKKVFVVGTGTDIGKTYVTGLILKKLKESGLKAAYYKAAMSGNEKDENGKLIPGDALFVKKTSRIEQPLETMCPYIYEKAYSPHLAARIEGGPVDFRLVQKEFLALDAEYEYLTMEGSGGILCPIRIDESQLYLEDIIQGFQLSCVLIADAGLGTINSVVLTHAYMQQKKIEIKGIIFNNYIENDVMHEDNILMCEQLTGLKTLAKVKHGDQKLEISIEDLVSIYEE